MIYLDTMGHLYSDTSIEELYDLIGKKQKQTKVIKFLENALKIDPKDKLKGGDEEEMIQRIEELQEMYKKTFAENERLRTENKEREEKLKDTVS